MAFNINVNPVLVWDNSAHKMVTRKEVLVQLVGNKGTVYAEEGPLYCETRARDFRSYTDLKT